MAAKDKHDRTQKDFDDYKERMKQDNDLRKEAPYEKGWIHYLGSKQEDTNYKKLELDLKHAINAEQFAKNQYDAVQ